MKFQKGQSGNPGGRAKGETEFKAACRKAAAECLDGLLAVARDPNHDDSVKAKIWICEQAWGKAKQATELTGEGGGPVVIEIVDG